ncbi:hypothetical protein H0H92_007711 [Tricholoma furcatifolium]|nr:hypothetical protein H0H92_007711 [Tricholoma furcatifolium]
MRLTSSFVLTSLFGAALSYVPSHRPSVHSKDQPSCVLRASGGDDAPQFLEAVHACSHVVIPKNETLNIETRLNMTGLHDTNIDVQGTVRFSPNLPYWTGTQITFWVLGGRNVVLNGGGTLDGAGQAWWDAFATNSSLLRPILLTIDQAEGLVVENIHMINSPEWHNLINESKDVIYRNMTLNSISASSNAAANTDGWDIYRSDNVAIVDSTIFNDDDCVSFKPNATNIYVANLNCTGSHSLGQYPGIFDLVENVTAINIRMSDAENGARIKAWAGPDVGSGLVKNITFLNFIESKVDSPVVIDQCYETNTTACAEYPSNTYIQDVWFDNISGAGDESVVASISCSPDGRCSNINVNNLNLTTTAGTAEYTCQNIVLEGNAVSLFPTCTTT